MEKLNSLFTRHFASAAFVFTLSDICNNIISFSIKAIISSCEYITTISVDKPLKQKSRVRLSKEKNTSILKYNGKIDFRYRGWLNVKAL